MRTTVRFDPDVLRRAKQRAIEMGSSLNAFIEDAVRAALAGRAGRPGVRPPAVPISRLRGQGLQDGVDLDDSAAMLDLMDALR